MNKNKVEILAPCGDMESLKVAVQNGADAVYFGMPRFNARMKAENFGMNLQEAVNYCHLFDTKVYITVNTLIKDCEIQDFLQEVDKAIDAGIDAVIIQDLGMAMLLKKKYPTLEMHASTQMGIHNLPGAKFLEELGFKRVVLARETKLEDIKQIKEHTNLDIEYFVQGALCVSFSGNCYLSYFVNGNSGNRGECKQLCRLCYQARKDNQVLKKGYLLSPADLSLLHELKELVEAGVTSLKIEGRLRRPGYVGVAVHHYKWAIDHNFLIDAQADTDLALVFSRGKFNQKAYLEDGVNYPIIESRYQSHIGKRIGYVVDCKPFKDLYKITIKSTYPLSPHDGLKMFRQEKEIGSLGVGNVEQGKEGQIIFSKHRFLPNDVVHLIVDHQLEKKYCTKKRMRSVQVQCEIHKDQFPTLSLQCGKYAVTVQGEEKVQDAKTCPLTSLQVQEQLQKFNHDIFVMNTCNICLEDGCFMTKSQINELRRQGLLALEQEILRQNKPVYDKVQVDNLGENISLPFIQDKIGIVNEYDGTDHEILWIAPTTYAENVIEKIKAKYKAKQYYLVLPVVANHQDLFVLDRILAKHIVDGIVIENYYGVKYTKEYPFMIGPRMNVYNLQTAQFWYQLGAQLVTSNYEIQIPQLPSISGRQILMVLCHCPYQTVFHKTCEQCPYQENLKYENEDRQYPIRRYIVSRCYFEFLSPSIVKGNIRAIEDMRNR